MEFFLRNFWNQSIRLIPRVPRPPNNRHDLLKQILIGSLMTAYVSKKQLR
jgi:hypothetical protein